jgi:hypothetical protein
VIGPAVGEDLDRMAASVVATPDQDARERGVARRQGGRPLIGVRLPPNELAAIDDRIARQTESLSRPVAIRRLAAMGLEAAKKGGKGR